ncbi:MAG: alanine racemase [Gammaproteobacteria bacterium]|nr:alanine racemase [Gammaproteobacteria bacterium]MBQ0775160.1 alanine racemase [Gammaproteobacteria bacterium]
MKRRHFLVASAGAVAAAAWLRPGDQGKPHAPYFNHLSQLLRTHHISRPALLIDQQRLIRNCEKLRQRIPANKHYRIVAKSLPSLDLIRTVMKHTGSNKVMAFHQPFINAMVAAMPDCDILLGKPMPVDAAENFYRQLPPDSPFKPTEKLQWLVDDLPRLEQYLALAQRLNERLQINLELDVGLHRGGLAAPELLDPCLMLIGQHSQHLSFSGFMGYDAHVGKLPELIETPAASLEKSQMIYANFIERLQSHFPALYHSGLTFNGAGSPTIFLHDQHSPMNELSAGSCLLKPTDFDLAALADFEPAAFIASPVIKSFDGLDIPGPLPLGDVWSSWDVNRRHTVFIYGGNWLAKPESPIGLQGNSLYGTSSNQMMLNGSPSQQLSTDDYVFLRPTQSESVLLQFGDLIAINANNSLSWWAPLEQGHGH